MTSTAVTLISATNDTCAKTAGLGMETSWTLNGMTTTYTGGFDSDGYSITAAMQWQLLATYNTNANDPTVAISNTVAVIGTCVETLTIEGTRIRPGTIDQGNFAICHWMYYTGLTDFTEPPLGLVKTTNWGETRILNEEEWNHAGGLISGQSIQSLGRALDYDNGFQQSNYKTTSYTNGAIYSQTWYQPAYAESYGTTSLRRYNGGTNDFSKVRAYCVSARNISDQATKFGIAPADVTGSNGAVSLSGATTLAAGAIMFGTAMLAF
jgi:hypothetical protein